MDAMTIATDGSMTASAAASPAPPIADVDGHLRAPVTCRVHRVHVLSEMAARTERAERDARHPLTDKA
jgi:hypothetical protein